MFDSAVTGSFQECKESVPLSKLQRVGKVQPFCPLPDSCLHVRLKHPTELCLERQNDVSHVPLWAHLGQAWVVLTRAKRLSATWPRTSWLHA